MASAAGGDHQRLLLEAVARELGEVAADLPRESSDDTLRRVHAELTQATAETRQAAAAAASGWASLGERDRGDILQEASALRSEAAAARGDAERELRELHLERVRLLASLDDLGGRGSHALEGARRGGDLAFGREEELRLRCESLGRQVQAAQDRLQDLSGRLAERGHVGVLLSRRRRDLAHRHAASTAQNETSREILDVQEATEEHVQLIYRCCGELEQALAESNAEVGEQTEQLHTAWAQEQRQFRLQEEELEARLAELHAEYAERWNDVERESRSRVAEEAQLAAEVRGFLEQEMEELDVQRDHEVVIRRERLEEQQQLALQARLQVLEEMEASVAERQAQIRDRVAQERMRCGRLRGMQHKRSEELARDVAETRANIEQVRESYVQSKPPQSPEKLPPLSARPPPSAAAASEASAIAAALDAPRGGGLRRAQLSARA